MVTFGNLDDYEEKAILKELKSLKRMLAEVPGRKHVVWVGSQDIAHFICFRLTPSERARVQVQVGHSHVGRIQSYYIYDEAHVGKEY